MKTLILVPLIFTAQMSLAAYRGCLPLAETTKQIPQIRCLLTDPSLSAEDLVVSNSVFQTTQNLKSQNKCLPGSLHQMFSIEDRHNFFLLALPDDDVPVKNRGVTSLHNSSFELVDNMYSFSIRQWTAGESFFGDTAGAQHKDETYNLRIVANLATGQGEMTFQIIEDGHQPSAIRTRQLHHCALK